MLHLNFYLESNKNFNKWRIHITNLTTQYSKVKKEKKEKVSCIIDRYYIRGPNEVTGKKFYYLILPALFNY
jgi:hypothetical protein